MFCERTQLFKALSKMSRLLFQIRSWLMYRKQDLKSDQRFKASFRCLKVFRWQELFVSTLLFDKCPYPSHKDLSLSSTVHIGKLQHRWMAPVLVCPGIIPFWFKWQERTDSSNSLWPCIWTLTELRALNWRGGKWTLQADTGHHYVRNKVRAALSLCVAECACECMWPLRTFTVAETSVANQWPDDYFELWRQAGQNCCSQHSFLSLFSAFLRPNYTD